MERFLVILLLGLFSPGVGAQEISFVSDCFSGTFAYSTTLNGRSQYTDDDGDTTTHPSLRIAYNATATRWEVQVINDPTTVFYATEENAFAPNPPDSETATWTGMAGCTGTATLSGAGTQSTAGEAVDCTSEGGDADTDGTCDDNDRCPDADDKEDPDADGIPTGCDAFPERFDGLEVVAECFGGASPLNFLRRVLDTTGRYTYHDVPRKLTVAFNPTNQQWELRDSGDTSQQVYYSNSLATTPNPPASSLQAWTAAVCGDPATVTGSGTQQAIPSLSCPTQGLELFLDADCQATVPDLTLEASTNLVDATLTQSVAAGTLLSSPSPTEVTVTAEDAGGNFATCMAALTVQDTLPPVLACGRDTLYLDESGMGHYAIGELAAVLADNCPPEEPYEPPVLTYTRADTGLVSRVETRTDASGNSSTCTVELVILDTFSTTGTTYWATESDLSLVIFPNPSDGSFTVHHPAAAHLDLYNAVGRRVWTTSQSVTRPASTNIKLNLPPGLYLLTATTSGRGWRRWVTIIDP